MSVERSLLASTLATPKHVDRPHYIVTIPNEVHQFDLLYMSNDTLYRSKYKYILSRIDVASEAFENKTSKRHGRYDCQHLQDWPPHLMIRGGHRKLARSFSQ